AAAVALLEIADERAIFKGEGETRLERQLDWRDEIVAQVIVDLVAVVRKDFARIKNVSGIERLFDLAHQLEQFVTELFAHVLGARDADAVLSRKRALELFH